MKIQPTFLDCPAYLNEQAQHRCGLPAEVKRRFVTRSTSGPLESVIIKCPVGHFFHAPIEFLTLERRASVLALSISRISCRPQADPGGQADAIGS